MAESQYDQYREDILLYRGAGMTQADIVRALEAQYRIVVKRSTFNDYYRSLPQRTPALAADGATHAPALSPAMPQEEMFTSVMMQGAGEEIIDRLTQLIEGVQQLKREGDERQAAVTEAFKALRLQETLERHTRQFEALFRLLSGAALWKIWLRAALFTGMLWGLALAGVQAWGHPGVAAKVRAMWQMIVSSLS